MRYADAGAFRMALEQRLRDASGDDGAALSRNRKRVAFDRLLARLTATAPDRWLLKGGFALELRLHDRARATADVDLEWQADAADALDALLDAAEHDAGDFFDFEVERSGPLPERLGGAQRFRVAASLAGRPFEQRFPIDVAPGFRAGEQTVRLTTPPLLAFAGIEPVQIETIPLERHVAEKLHAYTRPYEDGRESTRVKDLVDLALVAELSQMDAAVLRVAIEDTFSRRATHPLSRWLPAPPAAWRTPFRVLAAATGTATELAAGHATAAALLDPILSEEVTQGDWDPDERRWIRAS